MKKIYVILTSALILSAVLLLTGCSNTAAGFGKDLQKSGEEIQKAVEKK